MTVYRKLLPTELPRYREHLLRLDREDRYSRFSGTVSDEVIGQHCLRIDWRCTIIVGAFVDGELRGALELRTDPTFWPDNAELALSVERACQRRGVGAELLRRALVIARNRGIRCATMICLPENRRMQGLARKFDARLSREDAEVSSAITLEWPNHMTLIQEVVDDGAGALTVVFDQMRRRAELTRARLV